MSEFLSARRYYFYSLLNIRSFKKFFFISSSRLHPLINLISSSEKFNFLLNSRLIRKNGKVSFYKLQNIFQRIVQDKFIWYEVVKMFKSNFVNIFTEFVYEKSSFFLTSWLSIFFLEVYLIELDLKVCQLILQFNSFKNMVLDFYVVYFLKYLKLVIY